ncbi:hypothetical protein FDUTEX481_05987 [Tolypothrix sp. PCC 7601]|nr:hypothetical protein FDUTEX481_05987 [Tolypothrix sp. PCC 7601]
MILGLVVVDCSSEMTLIYLAHDQVRWKVINYQAIAIICSHSS